MRHHARRQRVDVILDDGERGEVARHLVHHLIPEHHRMLQRVRLGGAGQQLPRTRQRQCAGVADDPLDAATREQARLLGHFVRRAPVQPSAEPGVFAFGVLAHAHPVDVGGCAVAQRPRHAGQQPHRAQIDELLEALPDRQDQFPDRHVVGHGGRADRPEVDGIGTQQRVERAGWHHPAVREVVLAAPGVRRGRDGEAVARCCRRDHGEGGRRDFLADAVAGDDRDRMLTHDSLPVRRRARGARSACPVPCSPLPAPCSLFPELPTSRAA